MTEQEINLFKKTYNKIKEAKHILVVTHYNPDGDALSSLCAMSEFLQQLDKKHCAYCYDQPAATFSFLPNIERINFSRQLSGQENSAELPFETFDLILVFDCGSLDRTKLTELIKHRRADQYVIEIDHHPRTEIYSDLEIRNPAVAATTELLYYFFKSNHLRINKNIADCILTGILTDTANFLYPNTSESTISIASEMLARGAKLPRITENTFRNKSISSMRLWGKVMSSLKINPRYNLAVAVLSLEDIHDSQIEKDELDGISGFLSNLYGVNGVLLIREAESGVLRGSLRTAHPEVDISRLAHALGGGGHAKASGFVMEGRLVKADNGWSVE